MKKYILALIPFIIGVVCFITFEIIGSEVAADGTLVEPFFLIPIGFLFLAISVIIAIVVRISAFYFNTKKITK
ncbi:DUF3955 domain-containing protein [Clostridium gasigenes]|uniref:DUF3955 domain-containing protein n=1 Tax=Clostridium gasigenes TaxID=94869 RepID=UPI001C0B3370|nr:DUF3955 domain-containing protein [Clostridium gasigenes]MBU3087138.1 DUF3955 domain-containing protein [Clostridium gasigenes]MBU3105851.1 DUF3955 domain-containing protein [Clostridium gasigenes]MBU3136425.1 DUF3955 domain-containing protein [Clostridium gasigenes]